MDCLRAYIPAWEQTEHDCSEIFLSDLLLTELTDNGVTLQRRWTVAALSTTGQGNLEKISVITTLNMMKVCNLLACALEEVAIVTLVSCCIHCFGNYEMTAVCSSVEKTSKLFMWKVNGLFV